MRVKLLFLIVVLSGCATGYHASGFAGGFSETRLDDNVFQVNFRGNGYTSNERASDFTLLRSAEIARNNGYGFFIIVERGDSTTYSVHTTPTTTQTTVTASSIGNTTYGQATTTTSGGNSYVIRKPGRSNTIVCFRDKPQVNGLVYNVSYVYDSLTAKYGIERR